MDRRKTKARCPKCRCNNLVIVETCLHIQKWIQENSEVDYDEGYMEVGNVISTGGACTGCGHRWKFRTLQITDLFSE